MGEKSSIPTLHDRLFKEAFSHPETARDFFQAHLPARLVAGLDWSTLQLVPGSFIDEQLTEQFRTLLRYLFCAEVNAPSTFVDLASRIEDEMVKENVMSIADQLIQQGLEKGLAEGFQKGRREGRQEGRQEGLVRGGLIGRIQTCQELLNLPVSHVAELEAKEPIELETMLRELQQQVRRRLIS